MEDVIATYVAELLTKAGIDALPEEFKKDYLQKLRAEVEQRLGIMALGELDEDGLKKFEQIMRENETPDQKMLLEFFNKEIPDFEAKVKKTLAQFSEEFLSSAAKLMDLKKAE
ncbi:MAG: hypothetical protein C3F02_01135 [Parcubacteria group bacterium]|nr:MAG: hypothetical protein C3F02_01135 [Parcubacteria group bacterium]